MTAEQDDIVFPVPRQDSDTLEGLITNNAYDRILPERYLNKGPNGKLTNIKKDSFNRVAKNIAVTDAVYHNTGMFIPPEDVKPNHPH